MLSELMDSLSRMLFMVLHVIQSGSFPQPLSAQEEADCLKAFRERGDREARARLIEHNLRLVAHIVKKYYSAAAEQDELISIGTIGLIKAVTTFDHTKGTRLATYASRCIENEILMYFRAGRKNAQDVSFSEPIDTDKEGHPLTLLDVIAEEDCICENLEWKVSAEQLHRYMREVLEPREQEILGLRYGLTSDGLTQREVARCLGISRSYVSRIEKKALQKLRRRFEQGEARRLPSSSR